VLLPTVLMIVSLINIRWLAKMLRCMRSLDLSIGTMICGWDNIKGPSRKSFIDPSDIFWGIFGDIETTFCGSVLPGFGRHYAGGQIFLGWIRLDICALCYGFPVAGSARRNGISVFRYYTVVAVCVSFGIVNADYG
jgi:hypothetical protein